MIPRLYDKKMQSQQICVMIFKDSRQGEIWYGLTFRILYLLFKNYVQSNKESIDIGAYFGGRSMLAEYKRGWQNRTGRFFDLILHQR